MINLYSGENTVLLTLTERQTLTTPNYVFKFTHRVTNEEIVIFKKNAADMSAYKARYNKFTIDTTPFNDDGQYEYIVYEVTGNTTDTTDANILETGIAIYHADAICYTSHTTCNEFVVR